MKVHITMLATGKVEVSTTYIIYFWFYNHNGIISASRESKNQKSILDRVNKSRAKQKKKHKRQKRRREAARRAKMEN